MLSEDSDPYFTSLCSSKTLQSSSRGFFQDFAEHVTETAGSDWLKGTFGKLNSDKARINACYSDPAVSVAVRDTLENVRELYRQKSATVSRQRRLDGDRAWVAGDPQRALAFYNQSVMRAPSKGVDKSVDEGLSLAEALACRSEALQALGKTRQSISDIQMSVAEGYPEGERFRLYQRMAECYRDMGQPSEAKLSFQMTSKLLSQKPNNHNSDEIKSIGEEIKNLENSAPTETKNKLQDVKKELPELTAGFNAELSNASSRVRVTRTKTAGRFVVAGENIQTGDTLVAEPPYAACLLPEYFGSHCHHCFNRLDVPVGCPDCSGLAFCSLQCRDGAVATYHKYECKFMDMMIGSGMSILCHLALRMVTQSGLQHFLSIRSTLGSGQGSNVIHDSSYASVYNLVTHSDKRPCEEFLHRTLMALFLLKCLQRSKFFPNPTADSKDKLGKDELYVGSLLLRHLQVLQFNAHEVYETRVEEPNRIKGSKMVYIGVGIYPTVSLFNHDCYPAVTRYFIGRSIVIKATRPLAAGDMIAENYGPIFTKRPLTLRQRSLTSRYWFKCACQACKEDWPLFEDMKGSMFRFKCPTAECTQLFLRTTEDDTKKAQTSTKCAKCKKNILLSDQLLMFHLNAAHYAEGFELMESGKLDLAVPKFCLYLDTIHKIGHPPFKDIHMCQIALGSSLSLEGNVWIAPTVGKSADVSENKDLRKK